MFTEQINMLSSSGNKSQLDSLASSVAAYLEDYYELPATLLEQSTIHSLNKIVSMIEAEYMIQLKEENGNLIQIPLQLRQECMILN